MRTDTTATERDSGMVRNRQDDNRARFSAWLSRALTVRGLTQTQLRELLERDGIHAKRQAISTWVNGDVLPTTDAIVAIAAILNEPAADALRLAGHLRVAELVATGRPRPAEAAGAAPAVDPVIQAILDDPILPEHMKPKAIAYYKRKVERAAEDTRYFTDTLVETDPQ